MHRTAAGMSDADLKVVERLLATRASCRGFRPDPVPAALLDRILAAAQRTASWCNSQPWQVVVASGAAADAFRDALFAQAVSGAAGDPDYAFPQEYRGAYLDRRRDAGFRLYEAVGVRREDRAGRQRQMLENFRLFGAPHVAIVSSDAALGVYGAVDCGGYVANFLLAAEAAGVAAIAQAALALHSGFIRDHFGLADDRRVVCGVSFGFADADHPANTVRTGRAPLGEAVRREG